MRILNLKEFLELEGQVLFAKYTPQYWDELEIKVGNGHPSTIDFVTDSLIQPMCTHDDVQVSNDLMRAEEDSNVELQIDTHFTGRDGCYEQDQLFMVFSEDDVRQIIERLKEVIND